MPHSSEVTPDDEIKVFQVEGEGEDEKECSKLHLNDVKTSLVTEVDEEDQHQQNAPSFLPTSNAPRSAAERVIGQPLCGGQEGDIGPFFPSFGFWLPHLNSNGPYGPRPMIL
ncbi:uncharacterized protein CDAR_533321 [Caerostris darwini]|uniref:CTNNB1 binding N-teminal domain-containing protein n=1 Tax=Caerostris darwini TaxID=1538125 RepID=A0AAV4WYC1_9ARAC|nr:uncharacterized protein CDAR_533321 [Caerostris darwini]